MKDSTYIEKAKNLIASVKSNPLTTEELSARALDLAALILYEAIDIQTSQEKSRQKELAEMLNDPKGKVFTTSMTDQCFRSKDPSRIADQLNYLIDKYGIPQYLSFEKRLGLKLFSLLGKFMPKLFVPIIKHLIRKETQSVILPGEDDELIKHLDRRYAEGVRINLNHLGEAILGEEEARKRLQLYIDDLQKPEVEYISIKISTIYSQINMIGWDETLARLTERLRMLYKTAQENTFVQRDGSQIPKFVNLDMEEYKDLHLTLEAFKKALEEPAFLRHSAGIVLQSYIPDSYLIQQHLTVWAMERVAQGGAPIKIRIVKGANLAMEQVEASIKGWPQAPYLYKKEADANFKKMLQYGTNPNHAQAAHLGIASHNLFDIAYAILLTSQQNIEPYTCFEMLEGMADPIRRVVQHLTNDMLLYCPAATESEFQNAIAYLIRRLDENTAPDNFLRHSFELTPGSAEWNSQAELFLNAFKESEHIGFRPRRTQNRFLPPEPYKENGPFHNEPDTDWSLPQNRKWAHDIIKTWQNKQFKTIPLVIDGTEDYSGAGTKEQYDPSKPNETLYSYALASEEQIDKAIKAAQEAAKTWTILPHEKRSELMAKVAQNLRKNSADLIGAMIADGGKTISEADAEVSEAIDFAEYYRRNLEDLYSFHDISWEPKGVVLVTPPWNFPCSIPAGGILAALAGGNTVLFKPSPETILIGWELVQSFWEAGIDKKTLQFISCEDEPVGSKLIADPRINAIVLTGATETAKLFFKLRPGVDLMAETGGKNSMIITALSDRDLAVKDLVQSAFMHAGQKCSACSLAILEEEVYNDPDFRRQLKDAASSLKVGSAWDPSVKVTPLIREAGDALKRGLTVLDEGEEWLLEPKQDAENPNLWSPGIKFGVKKESFSYSTELFGPVLSVMSAKNLQEAIRLANGTRYGLTAGLHSLDEREQNIWLNEIEAGNCYINRGITGAIVQRQPFGGFKESCFGPGAKAGGPNYVMQFMNARQKELPNHIGSIRKRLFGLNEAVQKLFTEAELSLWNSSLGSYNFFWQNVFSLPNDPSMLLGQDNILRYIPRGEMVFRIQKNDKLIDIARVIAAAILCRTKLTVSSEHRLPFSHKLFETNAIMFIQETEDQIINKIKEGQINRIRLLDKPSDQLQYALARAAVSVIKGPVLANGRIELVHYLREMSISRDYHRYGNLGEREGEIRKPKAEYPPLTKIF